MTIRKTAEAFAKGSFNSCHNATTDGRTYWLHGHPIASKLDDGSISFCWCGWYTRTTANHMNNILKALKAEIRVSYSYARDRETQSFTVNPII